MKKRHIITSIIVLVLPVIVIYGLTNYGLENQVIEPERIEKTETKPKVSCNKKAENSKHWAATNG